MAGKRIVSPPATGLKALSKQHGGALYIQYGHDLVHPQNPPRLYWLIFDQPRQPGPNHIRSTARIEQSWGMSLRLQEDPRHRRTLDTLSLTYVLRGRGLFHDPAGSHDVRAGDLLLLFPGVPHAYGPPPGERWDEINVFFDGPVFKAWQHADLLDPARPVRHLEPVGYWLSRFNDALLPLARRPQTAQTPDDWGRLLTLIAEMCTAWRNPHSDPDAAWADQARRCLANLPAQHAVDWAVVACQLGVSGRSLRRKFKRLAGMTTGEFLARCRIERAQQRLLESDAKVAYVALELDFTNEFHFSRRFKQFTGLSPKAYRESHRNR